MPISAVLRHTASASLLLRRRLFSTPTTTPGPTLTSYTRLLFLRSLTSTSDDPPDGAPILPTELHQEATHAYMSPAQPPSSPAKATNASTTSSLSSALDSCKVDGGGSSHDALSMEELPEEDLLCLFLCDFLFDVIKVPTEYWSGEICNRAAAGLTKCRKAKEDSGEISLGCKDNVETIDLRGEHSMVAIPLFLKYLHQNSLLAFGENSERYLKVIVGCLEHGVGKGKLKNEVFKCLLMERHTITWKFEYDGSLICIKLRGAEPFRFLELAYKDYWEP